MGSIKQLLLMLFNVSLIASYVAVAIILIRGVILKRFPKKFSYLLWSILLLRLISPMPTSNLSFMNLVNPPIQANKWGEQPIFNFSDGGQTSTVTVQSELVPVENEVSLPEMVKTPPITQRINKIPMEVDVLVVGLVWIVGIILLIGYSCLSYRRVLKSVRTAVIYKAPIIDEIKSKLHLKGNIRVYTAENIGSPFVCGFIFTKVYLPTHIQEKELSYILTHEFIHIRRFDYLIKVFAYVVLMIHWFNPLMWVSFNLMSKDMEMSCDEKVMGFLGHDIKQDYSNSLLSFAVNQNKRIMSGIPLMFGESNVKSRIKNIIRFKKPSKIILIIPIIILVLAGYMLATDSRDNKQEEKTGDNTEKLFVKNNQEEKTDDNTKELSFENRIFTNVNDLPPAFGYDTLIFYAEQETNKRRQFLLHNCDDSAALLVTIGIISYDDFKFEVIETLEVKLPAEFKKSFMFLVNNINYNQPYIIGVAERYTTSSIVGGEKKAVEYTYENGIYKQKPYTEIGREYYKCKLFYIHKDNLDKLVTLEVYERDPKEMMVFGTLNMDSIKVVGDYIVYQDSNFCWKVQDLIGNEKYISNESGNDLSEYEIILEGRGDYIDIIKYKDQSILTFDTIEKTFVRIN